MEEGRRESVRRNGVGEWINFMHHTRSRAASLRLPPRDGWSSGVWERDSRQRAGDRARAAVRKNQRSARGCRGRVSPLSSRQGLIRARPAPLRDEEEGVHQNEVKLLVWSMCPHVFYSVAELVCCGTHHWTPFSWCGWSGGRAIGGGKATYRAGIGAPKWRPKGDVAESKRSACLFE